MELINSTKCFDTWHQHAFTLNVLYSQKHILMNYSWGTLAALMYVVNSKPFSLPMSLLQSAEEHNPDSTLRCIHMGHSHTNGVWGGRFLWNLGCIYTCTGQIMRRWCVRGWNSTARLSRASAGKWVWLLLRHLNCCRQRWNLPRSDFNTIPIDTCCTHTHIYTAWFVRSLTIRDCCILVINQQFWCSLMLLTCLGSLVGKSVAWKADCGAANFSLKNDCSGWVVLCCFAFLLCCCCCLPFLSVSWSDCSCMVHDIIN